MSQPSPASEQAQGSKPKVGFLVLNTSQKILPRFLFLCFTYDMPRFLFFFFFPHIITVALYLSAVSVLRPSVNPQSLKPPGPKYSS